MDQQKYDIKNEQPLVKTDVGGGVTASNARTGSTAVLPLWGTIPGILPSQDCPNCSPTQANNGPTLVYALGTVGFDYGSEAQKESLTQSLTGVASLSDPVGFLSYLEQNPQEATAVIWTLNQDSVPIYAIQPAGPFATVAYERLREFMADEIKEGVEKVSLPGYLAGSVMLASGQVVPVVVPEPRGMFSWRSSSLVRAVLGDAPEGDAAAASAYSEREAGIYNFLERVYYELRNLGIAPQERAVNYAATNAFQVSRVFEAAVRDELALGNIEVERSPIARPGSDSWDVKLTFFSPRNRLERANQVFRIAVDVSTVVPVTVGPVRSWAVY